MQMCFYDGPGTLSQELREFDGLGMNEWTRESLNGREVTEGERNLGVGSKWNRYEVAAREGCLK